MPETKSKKRIGILRGGTGEDYASSLRKGGDIILYIRENLSDKWQPVDILVDKDYIWHMNGLPINPGDLIHKVDVVWNTSHPGFSNILDSLSIQNIGVSGFSSALMNSRDMLRQHMKQIGVQMPRHIVLPVYQKDFDESQEEYAIKNAKAVFEKFGSPWIVKSFAPDSNTGMHLAKTYPKLVEAIEDGVKKEKSILVEEFIAGKFASVHSVPHFRGEEIYTFPLGNSFGNFSTEEREKMVKLAQDIHNHSGVRHYLKSDFILTPKGKVYLLSIELSPDLKQDSHFSQSCELTGVKIHNVIEHILENSLN